MKASISTGTLRERPDLIPPLSHCEIVRRQHAAGYTALDFDWSCNARITYKDHILYGDGWEKRIEEVATLAAGLGVAFTQAHLPFMYFQSAGIDPAFADPAAEPIFWELTRRAYIASGMLGIKYVVAHPFSCPEGNWEPSSAFRCSHEIYDKYVELGIQHNVGTAFENMLPSFDRTLGLCYCQHYEELIDFTDSFQTDMVGICWDTGHANQARLDQGRAIRAIGSRLKGLHINDNHFGSRDEHLLPFMGTVDWNAVTQALADVNYTGDMTLEIDPGAYTGELSAKMLRFSYDTAEHLMAMFNEAKAIYFDSLKNLSEQGPAPCI